MNIFAEKNKKLILGRQGENLVTAIRFHIKRWIDEFGNGTFLLVHKRSQDKEAYPCATHIEGDELVWEIYASDVEYVGDGLAQLSLLIGEKVAKSEVFHTSTLRSLDATENPPEAWQSWVDQVLEATTHYPVPVDGNWYIWVNGQYIDTGVRAEAKDGKTPVKGVDYTDGKDGYTPIKGVDYTDGHTPIMTGDKVGNVNTIYADGVPLISVEDGAGEEITHDAVINAIGYTPAEENAFTETRDKLDALWKMSEGRVYDIVEREENGVINPPSGAKYATVEEVRGNTTQGADPSPDNPQEIVSVYSFEVKHIGKNLLKLTNDLNYADNAVGTDGVFTRGVNGVYSAIIDIRKNKSFAFSGDLSFVNSSAIRCCLCTEYPTVGTVYRRGANFINKHTFTEEYNYAVLIFTLAPPITEYDDSWNWMVEKGITHTSYEPYTVKAERTITPPRPLNRIGDYFDKADIENGVWVWNVKQTTDADIPIDYDIWTKSTSYDGGYYISGWAQEHDLSYSTEHIQSHFKTATNVEEYKVGTCFFDSSLNFRVNPQIVRNTYEFISYFANLNIFMLIPRKEPIYESINDSDLAFLRSLENLPASDNIIVTDNHGRDVSYLVEYIRKLSEVN